MAPSSQTLLLLQNIKILAPSLTVPERRGELGEEMRLPPVDGVGDHVKAISPIDLLIAGILNQILPIALKFSSPNPILEPLLQWQRVELLNLAPQPLQQRSIQAVIHQLHQIKVK